MNAVQGKELIHRWLADGSFDERLPEVAALRGVPQANEYHAEGDAYVHTMLAVEAIENNADQRVFWAVLLHDIGKALKTTFIRGRWRSHGHEKAGARLVPEIMRRLGLPELAKDVAWLVERHDFIISWHLQPGDSLTARQRRLTEEPLFPLLLKVSAADATACRGESSRGEVVRELMNVTSKKGNDAAI